MNNKKVLGISIAAVVVLVIAIIATSYAVFTANITGTKQNVLTTGYVTMNCTETTFNVTDTQPMTDSQGIGANNNAATCTLTSTMNGTMTVGYDVGLKDVDIDDPSTTGVNESTDSLGIGNVKIQATKSIDSGALTYLANSTASAGVLVQSIASSVGTYDSTTIPGYKLDSATLTGNHSVVYTVKAWVASEGSGSGSATTTNTDGTCSNKTYTTKTACEGAGEIWGYEQKVGQAGGSFSFKLAVGASQVLS